MTLRVPVAVLVPVLCAAGFGLASACSADDAKPAGIDYSKWAALTPKPITVPKELFTLCDARPFARMQQQRGPHFQPAVSYFANADAAKVLTDDPKAALPVGGTIVKEKRAGEKPGAQLLAYAAMVKREKGYDPERGDWEYVYADLSGAQPKIERGKIESCIKCHSIAKDRDYLYRTHLGKADKK